MDRSDLVAEKETGVEIVDWVVEVVVDGRA